MKVPRLLVVEDEGVLAEELRERIVRMGLEVAGVAASGEEALVLAADSAPDLVLMDIRLKGSVDGIDVATAIRTRFGLPVIFLTAHSDPATVDRAKHAEPLGYLVKPFTQQELYVAIEIALHRHMAERGARTLLERQKTESLGRLAGGVAHDFSNLLVPITANVSLAEMDVEPGSPTARYLDGISKAADRAIVLCRQMAAYSGGGTFQIDRLDVNGIIVEMQELLRVAVTKRVTLTLDLAADRLTAEVDLGQVQQLLMNIVLNGAEAISGKGTIVVRTRRADGHVVIEVIDDGGGMDEEMRGHVFEPFFTTKEIGRGLGLAAAQGIARGHGGRIEVDSTPGRGSTFRIVLPAVSSRPASSFATVS